MKVSKSANNSELCVTVALSIPVIPQPSFQTYKKNSKQRFLCD